MNDPDVLARESRFTMTELRAHREHLMTERLGLIARYRKSLSPGLMRPMVAGARVPTARAPNEIRQRYDYPWIRNLVTELVYRAVRHVEVEQPYREKLRYYTCIMDSYVSLIDDVIRRTARRTLVEEVFEELWGMVVSRELTALIRQVLSEINVTESMAASIILEAILSANRSLNPAYQGDTNEADIAKNIMTEVCLDRNKRKTPRHYHRLPLVPLATVGRINMGREDMGEEVEEDEPELEGMKLSAIRMCDIRSLEHVYLPNDFKRYVEAEIEVWKRVSLEEKTMYHNHTVTGFYPAPSSQYAAAISDRTSLHVLYHADDTVIGKYKFPSSSGEEVAHVTWSASERDILVTTVRGTLVNLSFYPSFGGSHGNGGTQSRDPLMLHVTWRIEVAGLRITEGVFKSRNEDTIKHVPTRSYFAPLFTVWGEQPMILVACDNHEILRISREVEPDQALIRPGDIPGFDDIKNTTASGVKIDICKGHKHHVLEIIPTDEYTFLSTDTYANIIQWSYTKDCFDAYGRVIPKRYFVEGNDIEYVRLVRGMVNMFSAKTGKTRQDVIKGAKKAEQDFEDLGLGEYPHSSRENSETQMREQTFINTRATDNETTGVIIIRKILGNQLFSMKFRHFQLKNKPPDGGLIGTALSPCGGLLVNCFLFKETLYGVPYLSFLLLRLPQLTFLQNRIKVKLTPSLVEAVEKSRDTVTFCVTPPHAYTRASYIILRVDKSLFVISTVSSSILRATIDLHDITMDTTNDIPSREAGHLTTGHGLLCGVYGGDLVVWDRASTRQGVALGLREPQPNPKKPSETLESRKAFWESLGRVRELGRMVDPWYTRLMVRGKGWGRLRQGLRETTELEEYVQGILLELIEHAVDKNGVSHDEAED